MDYVTDTHALVWYFTEDKRLSIKAANAFEDAIKDGVISCTTYLTLFFYWLFCLSSASFFSESSHDLQSALALCFRL